VNDSEKTPEISSPQSACSLVHCRMNPRRPRSLARTWLGSVDLGRHILPAFDSIYQYLASAPFLHSFTVLYTCLHTSMLLGGRAVFSVHSLPSRHTYASKFQVL